jgi:hypothetical protein
MTDDAKYYIQGGQMDDEDRVAEYKECGLTRIPEHRIGDQGIHLLCPSNLYLSAMMCT